MSEPFLTVTLDAPAYAPGETLAGTASWASLPPRSKFVVRLGWWAEATGTERPAGDLAQTTFTSGDGETSGEHRFTLRVPEDAPPTMDGSLFSVRHAVEISSGAAVRLLPVVISPTRATLDLVAASAATAKPEPNITRFFTKLAPKKPAK